MKNLYISFLFFIFYSLFTLTFSSAQGYSSVSLDLNGDTFQSGETRSVDVVYIGLPITAAEIHVDFGDDFRINYIEPGPNLVTILKRTRNGEAHIGKLIQGSIMSGDVIARYNVTAVNDCSSGNIKFNKEEMLLPGVQFNVINANYSIDCYVGISRDINIEPVQCSGIFSDLSRIDPICHQAEYLYHQGIIGGYYDGSLRKDELLTKGQLAKVLYKALSVQPNTTGMRYSDVSSSNVFFEPIMTLKNEGSFGNSTVFNPDRTVNGIDMFVILSNYLRNNPEIMDESYTDMDFLVSIFKSEDIDYENFSRGDMIVILAQFMKTFDVEPVGCVEYYCGDKN